jgi:regulator of cell morphogenesis and NO signaling
MDTTNALASTLAELAVTQPAAARVFYRHGLDFCCGGRRSLEDACRARGLDPAAVLSDIATEAPASDDDAGWNRQPLAALVDHIVTRYHRPLQRMLPELIALATKVEARHGDKAACPRGLTAILERMREEVEDHLAKEEQILFPLIVAGRGAHAGGPVQVMEHEHDAHGANLASVRALTADYVPPDGACVTWRALYLGLRQLDQELMEHIHLENNILFPRALAA